MTTKQELQDMITAELDSDGAEDRKSFRDHFVRQKEEFVEHMSSALLKWHTFHEQVAPDNHKKAVVSALLFSSASLHVQSLKLFMSGHTVAAGNLLRQVIECICLALLCSTKSLGVLDQFIDRKYSTSKAVRDLLRNHKEVGIREDALGALRESQEFYHLYSHISPLTIATGISFSTNGVFFLGAAFDDAKIDQYLKEIESRLGLARVFENYIDGVTQNVREWNE